MSRKAIIYCRQACVSQHGDERAEEEACRVFAIQRGYQIKGVYRDEGISGLKRNRPTMSAMLEHIRVNPQERYTVLCEHTGRLARDVTAYLALRDELKRHGAKLEFLVHGPERARPPRQHNSERSRS